MTYVNITSNTDPTYKFDNDFNKFEDGITASGAYSVEFYYVFDPLYFHIILIYYIVQK